MFARRIRTSAHLTRFALGTILVFALGACSSSDDGGGGNGLNDPPGPPDGTPDLPTIDNPAGVLPVASAMLATGRGQLTNFVPDIASAAPLLQVLNDTSLCMEFQLVPGPCRLVADREHCLPSTMQWRYKLLEPWNDLVPAERAPCFSFLTSHGESNYYISSERAIWMVADVNCRMAGGELAAITTPEEHAAVWAAIIDWNTEENVLIGLFDWLQGNNNWKWRTGEPATWAPWASGEPNDAGGGEYFGHFLRHSYSPNGLWNDVTLWSFMHYIMEIEGNFAESSGPTVPVLIAGDESLHLRGLTQVGVKPHIERRVYWSKIFQTIVEPGSNYSATHDYATGTDTFDIRALGTVTGMPDGGDWSDVALALSAELTAAVDIEVTLDSEATIGRNCSHTAGAGETVVLALWQLRERFVICDDGGSEWTDDGYELTAELPILDQGLGEDYLQKIVFTQP